MHFLVHIPVSFNLLSAVSVFAFLFYAVSATKANNSLVDIQINNGMRARAFKEPYRNTSLHNY